MKKLLVALLMVSLLATSVFAKPKKKAKKAKAEDLTINLWAFTDEVPKMLDKYIATHPDCGFKVNTTIIATTDGAYQPALDQALQGGGKDAPDMYVAESAFVLKYSKGDMESYAMPYKDLGIDVAKAIKDADIAKFTIDIGSNSKGEVDGLAYQSTGGCYIYRRSVAKTVFGSDDPKVVQAAIGGGTGSWDKYWEAAAKCADKGVAIVSGDGDIWHAVENSSDKGWIVNGKLYIDPKREALLDYSKKLADNGWSNGTQDWTDAWFADFKGVGEKPVLGFFGPAWLINYVMAPNCGGTKVGEGTYGDWAVCNSPIGFFWGGSYIFANKNMDSAKLNAVKDIIYWITLDYSNDGLLYMWANGTLNGEGGTKDTVSSGVVMAKSNGTLDFLGGQNMFDYFVPANQYATGKNLTHYDETINQYWRDQVRQYAAGNKTREAAIKDFKQMVADNLGID
ncbi:MAG: carbohydrate ABC transporter substrate-binding protein [Candidatus Riflebacteria bacterium]|nr:carbohydrate ABC transporter substrate-binding protein [Candidatus Riflebacteria bacterium]